MTLRKWIKRLERAASENLESFELLDGGTYYYDRLETHKELFLHAYDVQLGDAHKWPEPPEIYGKMCEAKDPAAVLERFRPETLRVRLLTRPPSSTRPLSLMSGAWFPSLTSRQRTSRSSE